MAPAFAAGNAVVLKPSSDTPVTACLLAEVLIKAGMSRKFLSLLHGGSKESGFGREGRGMRSRR